MRPATAVRPWLSDADRVDAAVYAAIAATPTPQLDRAMRRLTSAADYSRLWLGAAAALAVARGPRGRRAAGLGLASVAVTSAVANAALKPLTRRARPDRDLSSVPLGRHVRMPVTHSMPSGHTASAFAFATAVGQVLPRDALALRALAAAVGYSRVHTGVHYPGDVVLGALLGSSCDQLTVHAIDRRSGS